MHFPPSGLAADLVMSVTSAVILYVWALPDRQSAAHQCGWWGHEEHVEMFRVLVRVDGTLKLVLTVFVAHCIGFLNPMIPPCGFNLMIPQDGCQPGHKALEDPIHQWWEANSSGGSWAKFVETLLADSRFHSLRKEGWSGTSTIRFLEHMDTKFSRSQWHVDSKESERSGEHFSLSDQQGCRLEQSQSPTKTLPVLEGKV